MMRIRYPTTLALFLGVLWVKAIYPPASGIADTDFYWHLTYGRWIVEHIAIPAGDIFSWTFYGQPYQLTQWLGEAAMGLAYNIAGQSGTKALSVALAGITIGFAWLGARRYVDSLTALWLAILCNLVQVVTPMRPQLFTFAALSVSTYLLVSFAQTRRLRYLFCFPFLMCAWVNLHGGFIVGLGLLGLFALGRTVESAKAKLLAKDAHDLAALWLTLAASLLASLVNPYGFGAIAVVVMIGGLRSASVISEWMPVNLMTELGWFYLLNLTPYIALMTVSGSRPRLTHGLLAGAFLTFGVMANRQVAMCAAVMAPMTAALLAQTPHYARMRGRIVNASRPVLYGMASVLMLGAAPFIIGKGDANWAATMNLQYPLKATDFLERHHLTRRVLSDTLEASYLIYRGIPVFVDGRMDLYRDRFYFEWYLASRAAPGWDALIRKHRPEVMLLRLDMAIRQVALATGQWKQVYQDERYSVLVAQESDLPSVPIKDVIYLDADGRAVRPYMP